LPHDRRVCRARLLRERDHGVELATCVLARSLPRLGRIVAERVARRAAEQLADTLGFDEQLNLGAAIVVTELATNLYRHAGGGEIILRVNRARELGDRAGVATSLNNLGNVARARGDYRAALASYEESLALRRELGDKRLIANSVLTLGRAELTRGDYESATAHLQEGIGLARELGDTWSMSLALTNLGRVELRGGGETAEAAKLFADALRLAKERGDKRVAAECLQGLGAVVATGGDSAQAAHLFGAGEALLESIGATPTTIEVSLSEQFVPAVKSKLGEERFSVEWLAGRAEPPEEAIEQALAIAADGSGLVAA